MFSPSSVSSSSPSPIKKEHIIIKGLIVLLAFSCYSPPPTLISIRTFHGVQLNVQRHLTAIMKSCSISQNNIAVPLSARLMATKASILLQFSATKSIGNIDNLKKFTLFTDKNYINIITLHI